MTAARTLTDEDVERIAHRVAELVTRARHGAKKMAEESSGPGLSREQAALERRYSSVPSC